MFSRLYAKLCMLVYHLPEGVHADFMPRMRGDISLYLLSLFIAQTRKAADERVISVTFP